MAKKSRTKGIHKHKIPKLDPVKYANELRSAVGWEKATGIAHDTYKGVQNALQRVEGREIMSFTNPTDLKKGEGFWGTVFGYLQKRAKT